MGDSSMMEDEAKWQQKEGDGRGYFFPFEDLPTPLVNRPSWLRLLLLF